MPSQQRRFVGDAVLALVVGSLALASTRVTGFQDRRGDDGPRGRVDPYRSGPGPGSGPTPDPLGWPGALALVVLVAALVVRRSRPRLAYVAVVAAVTAFLFTGGPYGPVLLGPVLAVESLATRLPLRQWVPLAAALPVMLSAGYWRQASAALADPGLYLTMLFGSAALVLPGLVSLVLVTRRDAQRQDRAAERRRDTYEERLRIAREVHDVLGHSLAVINLQAGVALHVLEKKPEQVAPSLEAIRTTSKTALAELSNTLATFRGESLSERAGDRAGADAVPPGLAQLSGLVAALRAAGRTVRFDHPTSGWGPLPAAVEHAALRIAQEGLTNVVRHAPPDAAISVELARRDAVLVVEVLDDGRPGPMPVVEGSGIAGIRDRARAVGGTAVVGHRPEGGFAVRAELPVDGGARP